MFANKRKTLEASLAEARNAIATVDARRGELVQLENEILEKLRMQSREAKARDLADPLTDIGAVELSSFEVRRLEEHLSGVRRALLEIPERRRPHLEAVAGAENALNEHDRAEGRRELEKVLPKIVDAIEAAFPAYKRANAGQAPSRRGLIFEVFAAWEARQDAVPCFGGPTRKFDEGGDDA